MRSRGGIGVAPRTTTIDAEQVLDLRRGRRVDRGLAADHAAEEPARTVDADEAGEALVAGLASAAATGICGEQLGAERALAHASVRAALPARSGRRSARGSRATDRSCAEPRTAAPAAWSPA